MRRPLYSTTRAPFGIAMLANNPSPVRERPIRYGFSAIRIATLRGLLRRRARDLELRLDRHRLAQRVDAGTALEREPLDLPELFLGRVAHHGDGDRHLLETRCGRVRDHVPAHVEVGSRHRLEAV